MIERVEGQKDRWGGLNEELEERIEKSLGVAIVREMDRVQERNNERDEGSENEKRRDETEWPRDIGRSGLWTYLHLPSPLSCF